MSKFTLAAATIRLTEISRRGFIGASHLGWVYDNKAFFQHSGSGGHLWLDGHGLPVSPAWWQR
jgi:hypothetical protein